MKEYIVKVGDDEMDCEEYFVGYIRQHCRIREGDTVL